MPIESSQDKFGVRIVTRVKVPDTFFFTSERKGGELIRALQATINQYGRLMQREAVANASGRVVEFHGQHFSINRITGNLVRNIHLVPGPLSASVVADADYAAAVEAGHPAIDLKKFMAGKIVPLPIGSGVAASAQTFMQALGSKAYLSTDSKGKVISTVNGLRVQNQYASTGKLVGQRAVLFRRVPVDGSGWIIPAAKPRPFLAAAAATVQPKFEAAVAATFARVLGL